MLLTEIENGQHSVLFSYVGFRVFSCASLVFTMEPCDSLMRFNALTNRVDLLEQIVRRVTQTELSQRVQQNCSPQVFGPRYREQSMHAMHLTSMKHIGLLMNGMMNGCHPENARMVATPKMHTLGSHSQRWRQALNRVTQKCGK